MADLGRKPLRSGVTLGVTTEERELTNPVYLYALVRAGYLPAPGYVPVVPSEGLVRRW